MNKTQLKQFATTARKKLEEAVRQKAYSFGITKDSVKSIQELEDGLIINGTVMGERERKQYTHLKNRIAMDGYETVMSEAAYTWFNRFVALRYMEVNNFLPIATRILSSEKEGKKEPDALTDILMLIDELDLNRERIYQLKEDNQLNNLYQYLLIKQSNKLGDILPNVFERITDDMALLLPDNLLNENSIVRNIVDIVDEESWKEVEIVGWLYQYYISEEKESFFSNRSKKADKQDIPAATQLFTPKWIVKYMVDNSLGKYWLESYPNDSLKEEMKYYLENEEVIISDSKLDIEDLSFFDPSCGSGHILVYAFDLFYKMYLARGYREREIPQLILKNNLYGLDIDKRAAQLATFALVMKAREYDRRLFSREYNVHIHSIEETNTIDDESIRVFSNNNDYIEDNTELLVETFKDAKLYGSIIQVPEIDIEAIKKHIDYFRTDAEIDIFKTELIEYTLPKLEEYINQYKLLNKEYDVVVTNPPYMGNFNKELKRYVNKHYKDYKKDLFSVFIYRCSLLTKEHGYTGFMTPMVWMFISSYENLRNYIINEKSISSLVHLEYSAFEDATVPLCTFVLKNSKADTLGTYIRLTDFRGGMNSQKNHMLDAIKNNNISYRYHKYNYQFINLPEKRIAYWASDNVIKAFESPLSVDSFSETRIGMATANNKAFMRLWFEVSYKKTFFSANSREMAKNSQSKWFPYAKGGPFRKWAGNLEYVVNWKEDGKGIRNFKDNETGRIRSHNYNLDYIFKEGITFTAISSSKFAARYMNYSLFGSGGSGICDIKREYTHLLLAFLNSKVSNYLLRILSSTMNIEVNTVGSLPLIISKKNSTIKSLVIECMDHSFNDWNSFETSWSFEEHPFVTYKETSLVKDSFSTWKAVAKDRFNQLRENEEELNRIFIDIYGLQDELFPEVKEKDVTVRKAKLDRDVKSFLAYLVGVMFGRYSFNQKGLAYAGGDWNYSLYTTYQPDETNIIPLTEDQYFNDDIMNKVEELLIKIYGEETLEENLTFISEALTKKTTESSRDRIRRYFMKEFYKDHLKIYQKRPIYWQFTSGKRGAFKGLMYLHRYNKNTIAQLRTDYVLHEAKVIDNLIQHETNVTKEESSTQAQKARAQKLIDEYSKDRQELAQYDQVIEHVAKQQIDLDLDEGVKANYQRFQDIEITDDHSSKPKKLNVFEKI